MGSVWEPGSGWTPGFRRSPFWERRVLDRKNDTVKGQGTARCLGCWSPECEVAHGERGLLGWVRGLVASVRPVSILGAGTPLRGP